ncbi:MAG TPA: GAF domain-containing sensor histidine kinase [Thermoanaerobaculia bacterium]|jgi:hypothetical protein
MQSLGDILPAAGVPPAWQTWWQTGWPWAAAAVLAVAGAVAYALRAQRRNRLLESEARQRTAELRAHRQALARQFKRLEVNNTIIKFVNARVGFSDLLQTILEGILFVQSSDRALALVAAAADGERFSLRAASGWRHGEPPADLTLERREIEAYLARAREVQPGIWTGAPAPSRLLEEERRLGGEARSILVMRIEVEDEIAGYLVIHNLSDEDAFDGEDAEALEDLRDHMASAFLKGRMMEQLRELNEKKNEFLGIAAHDLRNPLTGVIGFTDILLHFLDEGHLDKTLWRRYLGNIQVLAEDMSTMVHQLLDVAAIEAGKVELRLERQRLDALLAERSDLHAQTAREKGIDLELDTRSAAGVEVMVDRVRVGEVLDNLVSNAIKFTWPGGRVRVFCERDNGEVVTHVEDTGQGLETYELREVFTGKKLSARPTAGEPSIGLGLVIVKKIVELHRGRAWVASRKGEGSTFSFSLPRP